MLCTLKISNYALIDRLEIEFGRGLNVITGETGAGKSVIMNAIGLLLGGRADTKAIKDRGKKVVIEAEFADEGSDGLKSWLGENDIEIPEDFILILRREIAPNGRSRAFVNDTPVTLDKIHSLGTRLIDIHSQYQNQLLQDPAFQMRILDTLAQNEHLLEDYGKKYEEYVAAMQKQKGVKSAIARDRENADFMQYQLDRIDALALAPGEYMSLLQLRESLSSVADESETIAELATALCGDGGQSRGALEEIASAVGYVEKIKDLLPVDSNIPERLASILVELTDISASIEELSVSNSAEIIAGQLDETVTRISDIEQLARRLNVSDIEDIITLGQRLRQRLGRLEQADALLASLENRTAKAKVEAMAVAEEISLRRKAAANDFSRMLYSVASPLGMKNLCVTIDISSSDLTRDGSDRVEFLFSFNKNQTPVPVGMAASGGEISRLMLSIKSLIAAHMHLPTVVFDEVDTGVSGEVAQKIGYMMYHMSRDIQVLTITHLPQVAAYADVHFKVSKYDTEDCTRTSVSALSEEQRVSEIALMLSGDSENSAARITAKQLINNSNGTD